jgi:hypothetical protein
VIAEVTNESHSAMQNPAECIKPTRSLLTAIKVPSHEILCHKCFCRNDLQPHSGKRSVFELRSAHRLLSSGQSVFSIAPQRQSISLLARGVSDGDFWRDGSLAPGHPAKPMWNWHVRDPDFLRGRLSCAADVSARSFYHKGHKDRTKSTKSQ